MGDDELRERTFAFGCRIVRLCRELAERPGVSRQMAGQLLRSGTSIGANLEEAKAAFTDRDFACRFALVLREARETKYWLRLLVATGVVSAAAGGPMLDEADQLVAMLTVGAKKARARVSRP